MTVKDRTGEQYGRLTVLWRAPNRVEPSGAVRAMWQCRCSCGNGAIVSGQALSKGQKSCGCLNAEKPIKHGKSHNRIYRVWGTMVQRCTNPNNTHFHSYGARGITVCERWREFENFLADMGEPPPGMTLERIDNNKGYGPDNCRWASRLEQANNRRTNTVLTFQDQSLTVSQWASVLGVAKSSIIRRIKNGWSVDRILTTPIASRKPKTKEPRP